jgi:DNA-binding PadR family transcriptional regulator
MPPSTDLLQGTLDLLILKTLALEPMHGWGVARRIQQTSKEVLHIGQGSLYPALSTGIQRMDSVGLGKFRKQSTGEVLFVDPQGKKGVGG